MSTESRELPEFASAREFLAAEYAGSEDPVLRRYSDHIRHGLLATHTPAWFALRAIEAALAHSRAQDSGGEAADVDARPCYVCGLRADQHPWVDGPRGGKKRGPCPAAEQPAKGEGVDVEATDMGTYTDYAFPQPSDPADAVCDCGSSVDNRQPHHDECAIYATPPTAQRHDEDDIGSVIKDLRHSAGVDGYTAQHRSFIHSIANRLAMLSTAHGAGAAVEAVAWQYRFQFTDGAWSGWAQVQSASELEHLLSRYRELKCPAEGRSLFAAPPQQRSEQENDMQEQIDRLANFIMAEIPGEPSQSEGAVDTAIRWMREQVAGGGGVDALPEAKPNDDDPEGFNNGWNCCLSAVRKALSTQPLLSDQPGGVSNAMVERCCVAAYNACDMGNFPQEAIEPDGDRRFVRAVLEEAALHPEQAKDGAAG